MGLIKVMQYYGDLYSVLDFDSVPTYLYSSQASPKRCWADFVSVAVSPSTHQKPAV